MDDDLQAWQSGASYIATRVLPEGMRYVDQFEDRFRDAFAYLHRIAASDMQPLPKVALAFRHVSESHAQEFQERFRQLRSAIAPKTLKDYLLTVDTYALRHIIIRHGDEVIECARGGDVVTRTEIRDSLYMAVPTRLVKVERNKRNQDVLIFREETLTAVYEVRNGRRAIALVSVYKAKGRHAHPDDPMPVA